MKPHAYKWGFCDGIFNRECKSPWQTFKEQSDYVRGYMEGRTHARKS